MEIKNLSKNYGKIKALDSINLKLENGVHGFLGENGAGKTTLMRIAATIIGPDTGTIEHNGISWGDRNAVRGMIGYLPQKFAMYKQLTVRECLRHIAILKGIEDDDKAAKEAIEAVNLTDKAGSRIGSLSGGMVRRLGIAQAILGNPELIIADEPTTGLDPEERIRFRLLLKKIGQDRIVLLSTHIVDDAEAVCNRISILHKGKIIISGSSDEIKNAVSGKVWETVLAPDEYLAPGRGSVITDRQLKDGEYRIRILSDKAPNDTAVSVYPSLEEAYMWLTHEGTGS